MTKFKTSGKPLIAFAVAPLLGTLCAYLIYSFCFAEPTMSDAGLTAEFDQAAAEQLAVANELRITNHAIQKGSTLAQALNNAGLDNALIHDIVRSAREYKNLNNVTPGLAFNIFWQDAPEVSATQIEFIYSQTETLRLTRINAQDWQAELINLPIEKTTETFIGTVKTSLWESAQSAGMDPQLISDLAAVFAWQIDFNREVQPTDGWRIVVEKLHVNGKHIGWGNILAAEYKNRGELYTAVRFPEEGPYASYYSPDGSSLKRMFLKSPIKFGRISSRFTTKRFHPVLKTNKPHNGVDYAAPIGTPIMAVGKGTVTFAGYNGGSGNMVKIRHNGTYSTAYLHMSRIGKGIRKGQKVEQGQVIGYVGTTGLSTGPHLHFAFYEGERFIDPLGRKFPAADPVNSSDMNSFSTLVAKLLRSLPEWSLAEQTVTEVGDDS